MEILFITATLALPVGAFGLHWTRNTQIHAAARSVTQADFPGQRRARLACYFPHFSLYAVSGA